MLNTGGSIKKKSDQHCTLSLNPASFSEKQVGLTDHNFMNHIGLLC